MQQYAKRQNELCKPVHFYVFIKEKKCYMSVSFNPSFSTDEICVGQNLDLCLTDDLTSIKTSLAGKLSEDDASTTYASVNHTHSGYAASDHTHTTADITDLSSPVDAYSKTESDARFAPITHSHTGYSTSDHTHTGYASSSHTHTVSDISDLTATATELNYMDGVTSNIQTQLNGKAASSHTHTIANVTGLHDALDGKASASHTHSGYAASDHTHTGYALAGHTHTLSSLGAAEANHTHTLYSLGAASSDHTHSGYAASNHTHTGYALSNHTHTEYAAADHTHSNYAISNHTHDDYAASSHTHPYLPLSGGTVTGETNFSGGLVRLKGVQTLFHSGSQLVFGSNSIPTRIAGSAISATKTISVDSDERLKENIEHVDVDECTRFINGLDVKTFNYIGDDDPCIGVIAQEVNELDMADKFVIQGDDGYYSVKAADLVFPLIATVQKLTREIELLKNR